MVRSIKLWQWDGIQILNASTGKPVSSFNVLRFAGALTRNNCQWSSKNLLVVDDWTWLSRPNGPSEKQRFLRFFDVTNGRETKRWDVTTEWPQDYSDDSRQEMWSVQNKGRVLALATVQDRLRVFQEPELLAFPVMR